MGFEEFGHDGVATREFGFELFDLLDVGIVGGLGLAAGVECGVSVLEELLESVVDLVGMDGVLVAEIGDGNLVDEVLFEDGDLLRAIEVPTLLGHGETPRWGYH